MVHLIARNWSKYVCLACGHRQEDSRVCECGKPMAEGSIPDIGERDLFYTRRYSMCSQKTKFVAVAMADLDEERVW